jgi:transposase-like protein
VKWFQINRKKRIKKQELLKLHVDGLPFRALAMHYDISVGSAYNYCVEALERLPQCADVTREYCQKFSNILLVDGKYVKVKGYDRKIPVVYGIDYTTHDIPHYILSQAENYPTCQTFFSSLNLMGYGLQAVVCDDNRNIYEACQKVYPSATVQLCQVHYLRNVRVLLDLDHRPEYRSFFLAVSDLFAQKRDPADFDGRARRILRTYQQDRLCVEILLDLERKKPLLLGYLHHRGTPTTTNLIESFNSHLQGRLDSIKGFESFRHADAWLNGYFLRRRTKQFTDCSGKFRKLNGKTSLSQTQKPGIDLPIFF